MKRTAAQAFAPAVPANGAFQPSVNAMLDPKAYFAQFQQAAMSGQAVAPPGTVAPAAAASTAPAPVEDKSEVHLLVEAASAVKCAKIVQEKGNNFTTLVAIEALTTMATKSSYKLREELFKQPHVKKLCERVKTLLAQPPAGLSLDTLAKAAWSLQRFPDSVLGVPAQTLGPIANILQSADPGRGWHANTAARVLSCLAKADTSPENSTVPNFLIMKYKSLVSQVIKELIRDQGRRVAELGHEELVGLMSCIAKARMYKPIQGQQQTVRCEANDEIYFSYASTRICKEVDSFDGRIVADVAHIHAEAGIRDEQLFKTICPRILAKQKDLDEKTMGKAIKAYARFMIPLREEQQGFRTMAVVAKGDFIRPSEKPKKVGPRTYDHPIALYEKTQLHSRA